MTAWTPADVVALVTAVFAGLGVVISSFAGIYAIIAANRSRKNADAIGTVKTDVMRIERNTNSLTTQLQAASKVEGRAEKAAEMALENGPRAERQTQAGPLPVTDKEATAAAVRTADATVRIADQGDK